MAITAQAATSWEDIRAFLAGMKDASNNDYFTDVVLDTTNNLLKLYVTEGQTDPLCELSTTASTLTLHYGNNGSPATRNAAYKYPQYGGSPTFPCNMYKTPWGCLIDINQNNDHFLFGVCKSNTGKTAVIFSNQQNSIASISGSQIYPKVVGIHTYDEILPATTDVCLIRYSTTDNSNTLINKPFTALIPMVVMSGTPDYSLNSYVSVVSQTIGVYGSFAYQGHTYLTNGLISILDT